MILTVDSSKYLCKTDYMRLVFVIILLMAGMKVVADTHYVSLSGTNNPPYASWPDASTNIIWAVNEAGSGDTVLVSNGIYYTTGQVYSAAAITLRSFNGRDATILNGDNASTNRCVYFTSSSAVFDGFTVTNYSTRASDGALYGYKFYNSTFVSNRCTGIAGPVTGVLGGRGTIVMGSGGNITNCIFRNNVNNYGGGIFSSPANNTRISGCWFEDNSGSYGGGCALLFATNAIVSNCVFINNDGHYNGGGLFILYGMNNSVLNCTIISNFTLSGSGRGGGIDMYYSGLIKDCSIIGNSAANQGGGINLVYNLGTNVAIINCLIARNQSTTNTGGGIWATNCNIESCTIVSNYAKVAAGGVYLAGPGSSGTNSIIYFNTAPSAANFTNPAENAGLSYSCVIPAVNGTANITNNPVLKDLAGGDYRLRITSPCVNAGTNQPWMTGAVDLQGNARILKTIVDMGAYETRIWQGTIFWVPGQ